jgi:GNAT superfamily N-acetyltransferase
MNQPIEITTIQNDDFHLVLDLLEASFPDVSRTFFYSLTMNDPWYSPEYSLIVKKGDKYLSHLQIFARKLIIDQKLICFAGIGSVCTHPEYRGSGYSTLLLQHALSVFEQKEFEGSLLFTTIHPFYERLGWKTIKQKEQDIEVNQFREEIHYNEFRYLTDSDLPVISDIYQKNQKKNSTTLIRSIEYWKARPTWMNHVPTVVLRGDRIVAYFYAGQYKKNEPVLNITEYGYINDDPDVLYKLLLCMVRKAKENSCTTIRGFFQHVSGFREVTKNYITNERDYNYMMWNDVNDFHNFNRLQELAHQSEIVYWSTDAF